MSNNSSENYLDNLLESLFDNNIPTEKDESDLEQKTPKKKVPLDQDDEFLKAFEDELESDLYKDYFADFEKELEAEQDDLMGVNKEPETISGNLHSLLQGIEENSKGVESIPAVPPTAEPVIETVTSSGSLSEESLLEMESKFDANVESKNEITSQQEAKIEEVSLESLMAEESNWNEPQKSPELEFKMTEAGEPDLAGVGDDDLMELLAKSGELSDFGEMISEDGQIKKIDDGDLIGLFAENEMQEKEKSIEEEPPVFKKTQVSFWDKIKKMLFGEEDDDKVVKSTGTSEKTSLINELSDENQQILMELSDSKDSNSADSGKKKVKKEKKKTPTKAKPDKKKPPKPKKPPKSKKPKVIDNTPPLPKGPVILILLMVGSLMLLVLLGTSFLGYASSVSSAKQYFNVGRYEEAYQLLGGLEMKEKDEKLYNQTAILASVASEFHAYESFYKFDEQEMALDSLICAAGRCELNQKNAQDYECTVELGNLKEKIATELENAYGMSYDDAVEIYNSDGRREYTIALHQKLKELGLE